MEPNPIFQLELNQAKRNGLLWTLLLLGLTEGFSRFCFVILKNDTEPILVIPFFISLAFYLVQFFLPLSFAWKIASQRLNEDLILATAMSPLDVMLGKLRFAICCGALLYVPAILVSLLTTIGPNWGWWILYSLSGFLFLEYAIIIGLGFMAGAKTLGKTTTLVFLLGLFGIAVISIFGFAASTLRYWMDWHYIAGASLFFSHLLGGVSATLLFLIGVATLGSNLELRQHIARTLLTAFCISVGLSLMYCFRTSGFHLIITAITLSVLYFGTLFGALGLQGMSQLCEYKPNEQSI